MSNRKAGRTPRTVAASPEFSKPDYHVFLTKLRSATQLSDYKVVASLIRNLEWLDGERICGLSGGEGVDGDQEAEIRLGDVPKTQAVVITTLQKQVQVF